MLLHFKNLNFMREKTTTYFLLTTAQSSVYDLTQSLTWGSVSLRPDRLNQSYKIHFTSKSWVLNTLIYVNNDDRLLNWCHLIFLVHNTMKSLCSVTFDRSTLSNDIKSTVISFLSICRWLNATIIKVHAAHWITELHIATRLFKLNQIYIPVFS